LSLSKPCVRAWNGLDKLDQPSRVVEPFETLLLPGIGLDKVDQPNRVVEPVETRLR